MNKKWNLSAVPNLQGKVAIVTGGNIGLGHKSSLELARRGAHVVIACRSRDKGEDAIARIEREVPGAKLETIPLDLVSAKSIESFSSVFGENHSRLDILINNAGVVNLAELERTSEGREMHMQTNHLGHFALVGRLYSTLVATEGARVVTLSSLAYRSGEIRFDDLDWHARPYDRFKAYGDSKLANLLFTLELQRRFETAGSTAIAVAAHPGLTGTERQQSIGIGGVVARWVASPVSMGCRPQLLAATDPSVRGGDFFGPRFGVRGHPKRITEKMRALDSTTAKQLWTMSEEITGVSFDGRNR